MGFDFVKGSWEDRLLQCESLLAQGDPAGFIQIQALIDRIARLPAQQRAAANHRLNSVLLTALRSQAGYYASEERYTDAAAALRFGERHLPESVTNELELTALGFLLSDGQTEAAFAGYEALAHSGNLDAWSDAFFAANRMGDAQRAQTYIEQAERWVSHTHQLAFDTDAARRDQALLAYLKARHAVAQKNGAEALAWYEHAMALDEFYRSEPSYLYRYLVDIGAVAEALTLIRADRADPVRAGFWTGVLAFRQGRHDEAREHWHKATQHKAPADGETPLLETVMSHFYLGDKAGAGLAMTLDTLNNHGHAWGALFLAGLGWALRGNLVTAHTDLRQALTLYRGSGSGRRLPHELWRFCLDLLDSPSHDSLREFFDDGQL